MKNRKAGAFIRELEKPATAQKEGKKEFTWHKPVTRTNPETHSMATPHRLSKFSAVKPDKSSIAEEYVEHVKKRRGIT